MVQLTIEVPDELALRLQPVQNHLPDIIERGLMFYETEANPHTELIDFLLSCLLPQDIINFHPPQKVTERIRALLDKNRAGILTTTEDVELDHYVSLNTLMTQLKAKARLATL